MGQIWGMARHDLVLWLLTTVMLARAWRRA
jgi:hypothetical protein